MNLKYGDYILFLVICLFMVDLDFVRFGFYEFFFFGCINLKVIIIFDF